MLSFRAGTAAEAAADPVPPLPHADDPAVLDAVDEAITERNAAADERETPEASADRQQSRTAFADLGAAQALTVAEDAFPSLLTEPAWRPLDLPSGAEVERFYNDDTQARVDIPGEPADAFIQSTLPLRTESATGGETPVNLGLNQAGDELQPKTPLVETTIPEQLEDEASLPESGIEFAPANAEEAASAEVSEDTAFYANLDRDTDAALQPAPTGAHVLFQLRSEDSPEELGVDFDLPAGATIEHGGPLGGAKITRDGEDIGQVTAPVASDAEGWPVELTHRVEGDRLVIEIPHRSQDLAYPILVDPVVTETQPDLATEHVGWTWGEYGSKMSPTTANGYLETTGPSGNYIVNEWGGWFFNAPGPDAFIYSVNFDGIIVAQNKSLTLQGVYAPSRGDWDTGTTTNPSFPNSPINTTSNLWTSIQHCLGANIYCWGGTKGNQVWNVQWSTATNHTATLRNLMIGAGVWIGDQIPPTLGTAQHTTDGELGLPEGWVDDAEISTVINAKDRGLGVKRYELSVPGEASPRTRTNACLGNRLDRCPNDDSFHPSDGSDGEPVAGDSFTYDADSLPEGLQLIEGRAQDFNDNWSSKQEWFVGVDRTGPQLETPVQSLADAIATGGELHVSATDGDPGDRNPQSASDRSGARSGVETIEVLVDGETFDGLDPVTQECSGDGVGGGDPEVPWGSCELSADYQIPPEVLDTQHTLTLVAEDAAGNRTSRELLNYGDPDLPVNPQSAEVLAGEDDPDYGCMITSDLQFDEDSPPAKASEEVAFDSQGCKSVVETSAIPLAAAEDGTSSDLGQSEEGEVEQSADQGDPVSGPDPDSPDGQASAPAASSGNYGRKEAHGYGAWEDPIQLDVTKNENWVNWKPSQHCASWNSSRAGRLRSWRTGTGWSETQHAFDAAANCANVISRSQSHYRNDAFCPGANNTTFNRYYPNRVRGLPALAWDHRVVASKNGGCAGLLHFEHRAWRQPG